MAATSILFQSEKAPCGRIVEGEHFQDQDDEGLVTDNFYYACGCRLHPARVPRRQCREQGGPPRRHRPGGRTDRRASPLSAARAGRPVHVTCHSDRRGRVTGSPFVCRAADRVSADTIYPRPTPPWPHRRKAL